MWYTIWQPSVRLPARELRFQPILWEEKTKMHVCSFFFYLGPWLAPCSPLKRVDVDVDGECHAQEMPMTPNLR